MLFGKVIIYHESSSDKTMVYIEKIRTDYAEKLYRLCELLFADMDLSIEVFWATEHFGIIGNPSTMKINSMRIY